MLKQKHEAMIAKLAELDTGKAQPLFHTFPVINIFREDEEGKEKNVHEKKEEDKLLVGKTGMIRGFSEYFKGEAMVCAEAEGADFGDGDGPVDFVIDPDGDGLTLKSNVSLGYVALKATLGTISRYGMVTNTPSLTQVAVSANSVTNCAKVLEAVAAVDEKDSMSRNCYIYDFTEALTDDLSDMKIAVPTDFYGLNLTEPQWASFARICTVLQEKGAQLEEVELQWEEDILPIHEMVAACEKTMNLSGKTGLSDIDQYDLELGEYLLNRDNYEIYLKVLKVRSLIKDMFDILLRDYSLLLVPFTWSDDIYFAGANLAGLPALAMSVTPNDMMGQRNTGAQMIGGANQEKNLIRAAYAIASAFDKEEK